MPNSFNLPAKNLIRKYWNKPLLKFLKEYLNAKLIYLGLPSPEAEDVKEWLDYLNNVIAFQCRDYPYPSNDLQSREAIEELEDYLTKLERERKLENFVVFDGYIEEVILKGADNIGIPVTPLLEENLITVYNLDYCNSVTNPIAYLDEDGNFREGYKFDSIDKLLEFQSNISSKSKHFLFFFTIHNSFESERVEQFIKDLNNEDYKEYINKKTNGLKKQDRNVRKLRLYVLEQLNRIFLKYDLTPEFLPVIYYQGVGKTKTYLLHFGVIGTSKHSVVNFSSPTKKLIEQKFITTRSNNSFELLQTAKISETDVLMNPVECFTKSDIFKSWK